MPRYLDQDTLIDIAAAARRATRFVRGMDRDAFLADDKTQSAVIHQLLIIGEATKRLSEAFKGSRPEFPWADISRMRDYHINIICSDEDGGYIADIPDLDSCTAFGTSPEEALAEVQRAKEAWLTAAREGGKPIPPLRYRPAI